jgi:hypothetical protein
MVRLVQSRTGAASLLRARSAAIALLLLVLPAAALAHPDPHPRDEEAATHLDARARPAGGVPPRFVGLSIEWTLVDRYMGPRARPAFVRLLNNLGTGVLRIGGGSQELSRFAAHAADSERVVTRADLAAIRATLDAAPGWRVVLGSGLRGRTRAFVREQVAPAFAGAEEEVAGIELGNEPDVTLRYDARRYLRARAAAAPAAPFPAVGPNTSEPVASWRDIRARRVETRFFWDWSRILGGSAYAADHFYPLQRLCATAPYRCATVGRLLSDERMANLAFQVYAHARVAAQGGRAYRLEEINSAAGRGAHGVSDVAASAAWALDAMFTAACPQPPDAPGANADCHVGAAGVNFHDAEVNRFFGSAEGDAYYNPIRYGSGVPAAAPEYYALLLFARLAQGADRLRPFATGVARVRGWEVRAGGHRRLFLIGMSARSATVAVPPGAYRIDRMTPYDPAGRTLRAPAVRIDGRAVAADGTWPGERPAPGAGAVPLGAGETAVLTY